MKPSATHTAYTSCAACIRPEHFPCDILIPVILCEWVSWQWQAKRCTDTLNECNLTERMKCISCHFAWKKVSTDISRNGRSTWKCVCATVTFWLCIALIVTVFNSISFQNSFFVTFSFCSFGLIDAVIDGHLICLFVFWLSTGTDTLHIRTAGLRIKSLIKWTFVLTMNTRLIENSQYHSASTQTI